MHGTRAGTQPACPGWLATARADDDYNVTTCPVALVATGAPFQQRHSTMLLPPQLREGYSGVGD